MKHIMLDLETLSTENNAVILSIGACKFDPNGEDTYEDFSSPEKSFIVYIDPEEQQKNGGHISWPTVNWWFRQSEEARRFLIDTEKYVGVEKALYDFSVFCGKADYIWGNASTFDNIILRNLYARSGNKFPFPYQGDKCYRTFRKMMHDLLPKKFIPEFQRYGVHHHPTDDAISQAIAVQQLNKAHESYVMKLKDPTDKPQTVTYYGGGRV